MSIVIFSLLVILMLFFFHNQTTDPLQLHLVYLFSFSFSPGSIRHDFLSLSKAYICGLLDEPLPECLILLPVLSLPLLDLFDLPPEPLNFLPALFNLVTSPLCLPPVPLGLMVQPPSLCLSFYLLSRDPH